MKSLLALMILAAPLAAMADSPDASFYKNVAESNLSEIDAGTLAQDKGTSQAVKDFGAMMVKDHGAANDKLKALAATKSITLPTSASIGQMATKAKLDVLSGDTFDKSYIKAQLKGHKDTIHDPEERNCFRSGCRRKGICHYRPSHSAGASEEDQRNCDGRRRKDVVTRSYSTTEVVAEAAGVIPALFQPHNQSVAQPAGEGPTSLAGFLVARTSTRNCLPTVHSAKGPSATAPNTELLSATGLAPIESGEYIAQLSAGLILRRRSFLYFFRSSSLDLAFSNRSLSNRSL